MPHVLVVDDSAFDRELVCRILADDSSLTIETVEDGRAALTRLKEGGIDLVVTDLQMPEVNGLQLVTTIRVDHPDVPVILMTAMGSETIAIEALEQGAASYVPKKTLNDRLLDTVEEVLSVRQTARAYQGLISCFEVTHFRLSLDNNPTLIDPLVDYIQQIIAGMDLCDSAGEYQIGIALVEALNNALFRGNLEITHDQLQDERERIVLGQSSLVEERRQTPPYGDRRIHVDVKVTRDEFRCTIRDDGSGFDVSSLPPPENRDVAEPATGRGLVLIRTFMDEATFNDTGNEITLVKHSQN